MLLDAALDDPEVNAHVVFLAEPRAGAAMASALSFGRGFVCGEAKALPQVMKQVFEMSVLGERAN